MVGTVCLLKLDNSTRVKCRAPKYRIFSEYPETKLKYQTLTYSF